MLKFTNVFNSPSGAFLKNGIFTVIGALNKLEIAHMKSFL